MSVDEAIKTLTGAGYKVELSVPAAKIIRYNIKEAADIMGISMSRAYGLIASERGNPPRMKCERVGGKIFIHQSHIDEYLNRKGSVSKTKSDYEADAETFIITGGGK